MPNWCDNILTVEGSPGDLQAFVAAVRDGEEVISFERLHPTPPALLDETVAAAAGRSSANDVYGKATTPDWWHWRVAQWGTKWDACDTQLTYEEGATEAEYYLNTAWSPPEAWLDKVAAMFPALRFALRFVEEGMCFAGYTIWTQGARAAECEVAIPEFTEKERDEGACFWAEDIEIPPLDKAASL